MTDCARISLEFATAEGLERAATFVLQRASTFKNRVANPTDEGYRDLMFTVLISGHMCEVSSAPPSSFCPAACSTTLSHGMGAGSVRRGVGRWRLPRGSAWWQGVAGTLATLTR